MSHLHTHRCTSCGQPYGCRGEQWFNYDGDPIVVCRIYHERELTECESCVMADRCGYCGAKNVPLTEVQFDGERYCVEGTPCDDERLALATQALDDIWPKVGA